MISIPISSDHFLHVYLIEHKNVGDDFFESMQEAASEDTENEQQQVPYVDRYEVGAKEFIGVLKDRYCRHFLMKMADELVNAVITDCEKYCPDVLEERDYKRFVDYQKNKSS